MAPAESNAGVEELVREAIAARKEMEINYKGEGDRKIQPHALYRRADSKIFLNAVQTAGPSSSGEIPGWKQFELVEIRTANMLDSTFELASEYDPSAKMYRFGLIHGVS